MFKRATPTCLAVLAGLLATSHFANPAAAQTIAALVGANDLVHIDAKTWKTAKTVKIQNMPGAIIGIDVRPGDGMLYALAEDGTVATVDPNSGATSVKTKLETMPRKGARVTVDFNPVADRLRVIGSDGSNLRANVDDGKVAIDGAIKAKEPTNPAPEIVAGAYSSSIKGAKETALYDIDAKGVFYKQAPPNDGVVASVGPTGVSARHYAFDIATDAAGASVGWMIADGVAYKVDLTSGKADKAGVVGGLSGMIKDIAVLPN